MEIWSMILSSILSGSVMSFLTFMVTIKYMRKTALAESRSAKNAADFSDIENFSKRMSVYNDMILDLQGKLKKALEECKLYEKKCRNLEKRVAFLNKQYSIGKKNTKVITTVILVLLSIFLFTGCKTKESVVKVYESNKQDFSRYKTEKERVYTIDTLLFKKLLQETERIIKKKRTDTSRVETSYSFSLAWVDNEGFLHHEIQNKPYAYIPTRIEYRDLILIDSIDNKQTHDFSNIETKTIEVNKLNWWQKTQIRGFWISLALLLFAYRKQILKIIRL